MKRGEVVLLKSLRQYKFGDGTTMKLNYTTKKGNYFAVIVLDCAPLEELTEENLRKSLNRLGWFEKPAPKTKKKKKAA